MAKPMAEPMDMAGMPWWEEDGSAPQGVMRGSRLCISEESRMSAWCA